MGADVKYQSGFGNHFAAEALPGALPEGQNSPQTVKYGLYAEQLSGSAFTRRRSENFRSWLYRIRPSVLHSAFVKVDLRNLRSGPLSETDPTPNQLRWNPFPIPDSSVDFLESLSTLATNGNASLHRGCAVHLYGFNRSMGNIFFYNAEGEFLFVPQAGKIQLKTELGILNLSPGEIAVIPRGIRYQVEALDGKASGYVCENYGQPFQLPDLGPIGSNGLANPRDFLAPVPSYENREDDFRLVAKFGQGLWEAKLNHSPLDVVAWHGNYFPYKYDLSKFNVMNTVSFDHADPSIFTVLTSVSEFAGIANIDFVIFPPRWMVAEHSFRPPYFHRNVMSEFMGLIHGQYDAKAGGFNPGGSSLHNCMSGHGPDAASFEKASRAELTPQKLTNALAFMFESSLVFHPTKFAIESSQLQKDYLSCWKDLKSNFNYLRSSEGNHGE